MIAIMQEYGEIVCCIGSSLNVDNLEIFNQADIRCALSLKYCPGVGGKKDGERCVHRIAIFFN